MSDSAHRRSFSPTRWSLVASAGAEQDALRRREALQTLCQGYWYPLYAALRQMGCASGEAEDVLQEFFAMLIERSVIAAADPARGRFRAFLLAALRHFLANQRDKARAQKRGGGMQIISLDIAGAEDRYRQEPTHDLTAERLFDRRWAVQLLDRALGQLQEQYARDEKSALFEALKPMLTAADEPGESYARIAALMGMTPDAVKTAAHRLRRRYRDVLRAAIAETVADDAEIDQEIRYLFGALKST